jgi:hypothetical protein
MVVNRLGCVARFIPASLRFITFSRASSAPAPARVASLGREVSVTNPGENGLTFDPSPGQTLVEYRPMEG